MTPRRWRVLLHALDRTGPPMLGLAFVRWLASLAPSTGGPIELDVVAFRGGPLGEEIAAVAPLTVVLEDEEPWDHARPDRVRVDELRARLAGLAPVDLSLLVSVSAGQSLPYLPETNRVIAWVVEQGDDLHWLDPPLDVANRVDAWLAGSEGTRRELVDRGVPGPIDLAPEFVDEPAPPTHERCREWRSSLAVDDDRMLVVGAGIGTWRKAPDLFLEVALALSRLQPGRARCVWVGGERDPLLPLVVAEAGRLGLDDVSFLPNEADLLGLLGAADVLVHPARLDAFPLVCLSAAAVGTPVVAFDGVGGVGEMFGPAFRGAAYPDVDGLARMVLSLGDRSEAAMVAGAQQRRVLSTYTTERAAPVVHSAVVGAMTRLAAAAPA